MLLLSPQSQMRTGKVWACPSVCPVRGLVNKRQTQDDTIFSSTPIEIKTTISADNLR